MGRILMSDFCLTEVNDLPSYWNNVSNPPLWIAPFALASVAFSTDVLGFTYPAGTVWVIMTDLGEFSNTPFGFIGSLRTNGATGNGQGTTSTSNFIGGCPVDFYYRAGGIPVGASASIQIYTGNPSLGGTLLYTTSITGANGASQLLAYNNIFSSSIPPQGYWITSTWTGGYPQSEIVCCIEQGGNASVYAVPGSLPTGYTARLDTDIYWGGDFVNPAIQASPYRARVRQPVPYSNWGLVKNGGNTNLGLPAWSGNPNSVPSGNTYNALWVSGVPGIYTWMPTALGRGSISGAGAICGAFGFGGGSVFYLAPGSISLTTMGARAAIITVQYQQIGPSTSGPNDGNPGMGRNPTQVVLTVKVDGVLFYTQTWSGNASITALSTPYNITLGPMLPATLGNTCAITVTWVITGTPEYNNSPTSPPPPSNEDWTVSASILASPRCDIPLPFSCPGSGFNYPGGYLPSHWGGALTNDQVVTPTATTTLTVGTTDEIAVFTGISADGWYKVINSSSVAQTGIGEDEFNYNTTRLPSNDVRICARGHVGTNFYCLAPQSSTYTLTPYSFTPTTLSSSVTTLDWSVTPILQQLGSYVFAAAGTKTIKITMTQAALLGYGMVISISNTDPQCVDYQKQYVFETWDWSAGRSNSVSPTPAPTNSPPGSPVGGQCAIVGTLGTGLFSGHNNCVAIWDSYQGLWYFETPGSTPFVEYCYPYFWNGTSWQTISSSVVFQCPVGLTAPGTVYIMFEPFCTDRVVGYAPPQFIVQVV
jgi:hypothetical protein